MAFGSGKFLVKSTRGAVILRYEGALGISRAKGLRVKNDEVSVAEILVREGWSHHVPPRSRSRWRVILVMVAVVLGCGTAAMLVRTGHSADHQAQPLEQIIIEMPQRTSGIAGADATPAPEQSNVPGGTGAGSRTTGPRTSGEQGTTTRPVSSPGHTSASTSGTTTPRVTPSTTGRPSPGTTSTTPSNSPSSSPPPPPTTSPCFLFFC